MTNDMRPLPFKVQQLDRDSDVRVDVGSVSFGPRGELAVVAAEPKLRRYLTGIVDEVNAETELVVKVLPPEGAEPFSVFFRKVPRTSPNLLERMRQYLEQKHDLVLVEADTEPMASGAPLAASGSAQRELPLNERLKGIVPKVKAALASRAVSAARAEESVRKAIEAAKSGDEATATRLLDEADRLLGQ
jgi:hypothetical protein